MSLDSNPGPIDGSPHPRTGDGLTDRNGVPSIVDGDPKMRALLPRLSMDLRSVNGPTGRRWPTVGHHNLAILGFNLGSSSMTLRVVLGESYPDV